MPRRKTDTSRRTSVRTGNISGVSGNVNVAGGNITTHHTVSGLSGVEIKQLFDQLYAKIEIRPETPPAVKEDLKAEVKEIQAAVTDAAGKNQKVDESFLARHFRNIARMAPDVLEVIVATLASPFAGLGVAVRKIAEKAKADTSST